MKLVILGLSITSSWGNGHATLPRGLFSALVRHGHQISFFERDTPYYAPHRDLLHMPGVELHLYADWNESRKNAERALNNCDVAMVTSYCPDGVAASELSLSSRASARVFYDLDTPVTLAALERDGVAVASGAHYLEPSLIPEFDLYLSFTGGPIRSIHRFNRR